MRDHLLCDLTCSKSWKVMKMSRAISLSEDTVNKFPLEVNKRRYSESAWEGSRKWDLPQNGWNVCSTWHFCKRILRFIKLYLTNYHASVSEWHQNWQKDHRSKKSKNQTAETIMVIHMGDDEDIKKGSLQSHFHFISV